MRVFGSWARGEAQAVSDLDVAVVVEHLTRGAWAEAIDDAVVEEPSCACAGSRVS